MDKIKTPIRLLLIPVVIINMLVYSCLVICLIKVEVLVLVTFVAYISSSHTCVTKEAKTIEVIFERAVMQLV